MQMAEGMTGPLPPRSDAHAYTKALVRRAIDLYDSKGLEDTLAYYNSVESIDGQWYVFIIDGDWMIAHAANPTLVDKHVSASDGPNGYPAGEAVAAVADEDGEWFSYTYPNPASGGTETKHSWIVLHDGITFGSGWYEGGPRKSDASAYTKAFVRQAMDLYDAVGLEDTLSYYNSEESVDGQWYVFIIDEDRMIAHAANPSLVDKHVSASDGPNGYPAGEAVAAVADEDGEWFSYTYPNPATGAAETKHSWIVLPRRHHLRLRMVRGRPSQVRRARLHQVLRRAGHQPLRCRGPGGLHRLLQLRGEH